MSTLTDRVEALEEIVKPNKVILTDPLDPNCQVHIELLGGEYKVSKVLTTVETLTEVTELQSIEVNPEAEGGE